MEFVISYEDLKKVLGAFYNSPYKTSAPYVDMLHSLREKDGKLTLKERIDLEVEALNKAAMEKQDGKNGNN